MWMILFFCALRAPRPARHAWISTSSRPRWSRCSSRSGRAMRAATSVTRRARRSACRRCRPGRTAWTDEQSQKNFEMAKRFVLPGVPKKSRLLTMPLAHEAGGTEFHPGGKHWEIAERSRMEGARRLGERQRGDAVSATICASATSSATRRKSCSIRVTANTSTSASTSFCARRRPRRFRRGPSGFSAREADSGVESAGAFRSGARAVHRGRRASATRRSRSATEFRDRPARSAVIVTVETVYVLVDAADADEAAAARRASAPRSHEGARGRTTDHAACQSAANSA